MRCWLISLTTMSKQFVIARDVGRSNIEDRSRSGVPRSSSAETEENERGNRSENDDAAHGSASDSSNRCV